MCEREPSVQAREDRLAAEILEYARHRLTVELRFLDTALNRLRWFILPEHGLATDGTGFGYDPRFVLKTYREEPNRVARAYLHSVLHCVFRHVYQAAHMDRSLWDLACDAAVEYVINSLDVPAVRCPSLSAQQAVLSQLEQELEQVTAERIYRYWRDLSLSTQQLSQLGQLFFADEHFNWYSPEPLTSGERRAGGNQGGRHQLDSENGKQTEGGGGENGRQLHEQEAGSGSEAQEDWEQIARRMQTELETTARNRGLGNGALLQNLKTVTRETYDYTSFLRRFSVMGEHLKLSPDEFDLIFYTYGLSRYGNLPLIEPLEYSENRHVREFVIAIDTSGSVKGPLVQGFIQKTYNILKSTESFASRVNIHIIQCDKEIRAHVKLTSLQEFDGYLRSMKLKGFGGTDFRPVFQYVDELIQAKEFRNLRGLLYFTDGRGEFPRRKPPYEAAFVFLNQIPGNLRLPPWAIQMILQEEEINTL